jgi:hypothetical protein
MFFCVTTSIFRGFVESQNPNIENPQGRNDLRDESDCLHVIPSSASFIKRDLYRAILEFDQGDHISM